MPERKPVPWWVWLLYGLNALNIIFGLAVLAGFYFWRN